MSVFADFRIPLDALPAGEAIAAHPDVTLAVERFVPTGSQIQYLWVSGGDREAFVADLREDPAVERVSSIDRLPERELLRVEWARTDAPLVPIIEEAGANLMEADGSGDGWSLRLRFERQTDASAFYERATDAGVDLRLRGIDGRERVERVPAYGLSPTQRETIVRAFERGYFDVPRGTTIAELADDLGVSQQAVSERLRRGISRFLDYTIRAGADRVTSDASDGAEGPDPGDGETGDGSEASPDDGPDDSPEDGPDDSPDGPAA
ncbi:MAG: helix-turn-helix domain-containing protein [Salinigranum sp.]